MSYILKSSTGSTSIADDLANKLLQSQKFLARCSRIFAYKYIIQKNLDELIIFLRSHQEDFCGLELDTAECNRLLYNVENTIYAFEQYFNKQYGHAFEQIKRDFCQRYFDYSIISALRGYMEHCDLGVSKVIVTAGKYGTKAKAYINIKKIAEDMHYNRCADFKQKVAKLIDEGKDIEIELLPLLNTLKAFFMNCKLLCGICCQKIFLNILIA